LHWQKSWENGYFSQNEKFVQMGKLFSHFGTILPCSLPVCLTLALFCIAFSLATTSPEYSSGQIFRDEYLGGGPNTG